MDRGADDVVTQIVARHLRLLRTTTCWVPRMAALRQTRQTQPLHQPRRQSAADFLFEPAYGLMLSYICSGLKVDR